MHDYDLEPIPKVAAAKDANTPEPVLSAQDNNALHPLGKYQFPYHDERRKLMEEPGAELRLWHTGEMWPYCTLCCQWSDVNHIGGKRHQEI